MLKARKNPQDEIILKANADIAKFAQNISLGHPVSQEQNAMIIELNKQLSPKARLLSVQDWERIHGKEFDNWA